MQYIKGLKSYRNERKTAVTLGKFDGLHLGHETLIRRVMEHQQKEDVDSVVVAFDMSPLFQKRGLQKKGLLTNAERAERLEGRVDYLVECPFEDQIATMEAEAFIKEVLVKLFHAKYIVVGTDFHFGYGKRGDSKMLEEYSEQYGYQVEVIEKKCHAGRIISSTYIKEALTEGKMQLVEELLGYPYTVSGQVIHGRQLGRTIGIPTMNIRAAKEKLLPPNGVYVSRIKVDGRWHEGICNIGVKPTVTKQGEVLLESHLFDYREDAYGKEIAVSLLDYERSEKKFASVAELQQGMEKDIAYGKKYFDRY